ncbi:MAG: helix-turn-helix domain-containing protein [Bacteroidetes bacterium]|nr:helix-turn-helix domain-containing protein [Bacteroidota bacterium]MBS1540189.1 helix-turn-helix domain-containing protein [Bacteroidota bacterium]
MIRPIKNNDQYESALSRIYGLIQKKLKKNSAESNELEVLSVLVKEYENVHFPMEKPNPLNAIRFRMEQQGITEAELSTILGHRTRKSEILSGKRKLSLTMIRRLNKTLNIPADVLIQDY